MRAVEVRTQFEKQFPTKECYTMSADYVFSESNPATRASRAGDRFHYCWAAKRSLLLLHPKPELEKIVIEGDDSSGADGGGLECRKHL